MSPELDWQLDRKTRIAANRYPLHLGKHPKQQFQGRPFSARSWNRRVFASSRWPLGAIKSSPIAIIEQFHAQNYLQAVAMVTSWGSMGRTSPHIWNQPLTLIDTTLAACAKSIVRTKTIDESWRSLTGHGNRELGWTPVMSSKTLHFLCRALSFDQNPPVAIDNAVILNKVWPKFRDSIPIDLRPDEWRGRSMDAYLRYMTAVLTWAKMLGWTTTEVEATVFAVYG